MEDLRIGKKDLGVTFPVIITEKAASFQEGGKYPKVVYPYIMTYQGFSRRLLATQALENYLQGFQVGSAIDITFVQNGGKFGYSVVAAQDSAKIQMVQQNMSADAQEAASFSIPNPTDDGDPGPVEPSAPEPEKMSTVASSPQTTPVANKRDTINADKQDKINLGLSIKMAIQSMGPITKYTKGLDKEIRTRSNAIYSMLTGMPCPLNEEKAY